MHTAARMYAIITLFCALVSLSFQGVRIYSLLQVWEKVPGVEVHTYTVKQKWIKPGYSLRNPDHYYISWKKGVVDIPSEYALMLSKERWDNIKVGQPVVVYFPSLQHEPHMRNNYTDTPLEITIIIVIALASLIVIVWMIAFLLRARPTVRQPWDDVA